MSLKGYKAFNRCDVKVVEFKRRIRVYTDNRRTKSASLVLFDEEVTPEQRQNSRISGYGAALHCPRIEDDDRLTIESDGYSYETQSGALISLRRLAGELICRDCRFSTMTPVEVSIERRKLNEAETERLQAHAQYLAALAEIEGGELPTTDAGA